MHCNECLSIYQPLMVEKVMYLVLFVECGFMFVITTNIVDGSGSSFHGLVIERI